MFADRTNWNLAPNRLSEALARHRAAGKPLIDLTVSNPTECGFEYDERAILDALRNPAALKYEPDPKGLLVARQAIAGYYAERGVNVAADDIVVTTSTSEAYSFVFRLLCNPGDEVLVPAPSYPLFGFLADIQDVKLVHYPLIYDHGWQIDFHSLEQAITPRTRAVIVVHPNNPTGHFTKTHEIAKLKEICASKQLAIIADEVFLDFAMDASRPESFAASAGIPSALTFTMSGISKIAGLPQMKVAWIVVDGPERSKTNAVGCLEVIADTFLSVNTAAQMALPALLGLRHAFQGQMLDRVRANLNELDRQLSSHPSFSRLTVEGGWYSVLRGPATDSDDDLALNLIQRGVSVHPGSFYDFATKGYLVLSLILPERTFCDGISTLLALASLIQAPEN
jgi:aspartate/methionine/tyrosine aminotransferase